MEKKQTKVSSFLSKLLPTVKIEPVYNQQTVAETAAIVFITAFLIILTFYSFKKFM